MAKDQAASSLQDNTDRSVVAVDDDRSSLSSDNTQNGVKNIEAVSQIWTKSSLISAYLG